MDRAAKIYATLLTILVVGLILAVTDMFTVTISILLLIFAGILFGIFLNGLSRWVMQVASLSYLGAYSLVVVLLFALMVAGFNYLGYQVGEKASELGAQLQSSSEKLNQRLAEYEWVQKYLTDESQIKDALARSRIVPKVMQGFQLVLWGITGALVILFVGLYVAYDPDLYMLGVVKLVPLDRRDRATEVLHQLNGTLARWIVGRLISMSLVGVLTAIGMWTLGVPLPMTLGGLAALLTFIPNFGPVLAAVPQALLALEVGTDTVLYVVLLNLILQTVESYLFTPMVQRYKVSLPPVLTILAQLLMAVIAGVIGVMMAAPMTAAATTMIKMLYVEDYLGDPQPGELNDNNGSS